MQRYNLAAGIVTKATSLSGAADDTALNDLADRLGGIMLSDDLRGKLTTLGNTDTGRKAVAQIILAGPSVQAL